MTLAPASRRDRLVATFGPSLIAACSQGLALAQLALLLLDQPAGPPTDAYFLLFTWSLVPIQVALVGVAYPRWLRGEPFGRRAAGIGMAAVALGGAASAAVAAGLFARLGGALDMLPALALLLGANSAVMSLGWAGALRSAARGRGAWLAGVTLPSNLFACLALIASRGGPEERVLWMCGGLLLGSAVFAVVLRRRAAPGPGLPAGAARGGSTAPTDSRWFAARSVGGYGAGLVLQTMTASIPSPGLTYVNVLARLVSGFSTVVTNALLPRMVSAGSTSGATAIRYCWVVTSVGTALGVALAVVAGHSQSRWVGLAAVGCAWIVATTLNATVQRVATRFAPARLASISVTVSVAVAVAALGAGGLHAVGMASVLAAFVALDLLTGVAYSFVLGRRLLASVALLGAVATLALSWTAVGR